MNLKKINENLTKAMIGTFVSFIALCIVTLFIPIVAYLVVGILYMLMIVTFTNFMFTTYLFIMQMNKMIEDFLESYERQVQQ
jgi:hypothetical protein